jgi:hypothetical protein
MQSTTTLFHLTLLYIYLSKPFHREVVDGNQIHILLHAEFVSQSLV